MFDLLWLVPALPAAGFLVLALLGHRLPRPAAVAAGVGSVGLSAALTLAIAASFFASPPPGHAFSQTLWTWMAAGRFRADFAFHLDPLSLVMLAVVTVVGFLIHVYSVEFMRGDEGFARFFAYMNLFVASMVTLVLARNLLVLYLGWEGVGLCSYLLIGFWYRDPANVRAGRKAFIVTRVGDTALAIGLFLIVRELGTLDIPEVLQRATAAWTPGTGVAAAAAALLLGGAIGKSAQVPLQVWLPDAMAGPTPTSALIHAATMVTAGVYLIARTHVLFTLAPQVQLAVAVVGVVTLLLAGFSALTQSDIKRILAYSTVSQIGYMFLALGVGAWTAAMFHFMTHAFFKALLFLAAGMVIESLHHEHDIFRMGGLRRRLPVAFWAFAIGGSALAGLPLVTAGFYSKDAIVWAAYAGPLGNGVFWTLAVLGVLLTSLYTFRLIFVVFFGEARTEVGHRPGPAMVIPVVVLAVLSVVAGFVNVPPTLGDLHLFNDFLAPVLPVLDEHHGGAFTEAMSEVATAVVFAVGLAAAWFLVLRRGDVVGRAVATPAGAAMHRFWQGGWGFDWLYDLVFVRPVTWLASANRDDVADVPFRAAGAGVSVLHLALSATQTGHVRWYAAGIAGGSIAALAIVLFL
ncbi:MAG TPA: NADH-quinone oxidoreductase subunit L [Vicinamibacterales bacterium]|nr:NADH-quinone oxidoreductase subunit L [Vicinamibacterales bacterium]